MLKIDSKNALRILIIGLGVLLVIIAIGIVSSRVASQNKLAENTPSSNIVTDQALEENFKIVYILDKGDGQEILTFDYILREGVKQTVFDALKDISVTKSFDLKYNNNYSYGVFVESIAGVKNGDEGKYWQYYVNDKLGEVAADKKEVKAGDKVEWRFEKVPEI
ncbi:MAG: DUF4430 domain-containing protein [Patescibacteria group bacterium]